MKATESRTDTRDTATTARAAKAADKDEAKADTPKAEAREETQDKPQTRIAGRGECVVDDGTAHAGRTTPGAAICSAHAMHYRADGTPRAEYVKAADVKAEDVKRDE